MAGILFKANSYGNEKDVEVTPWIGVDLDGTLAAFDGWQGWKHIGDPIKTTVDRVKLWRKLGIEVRVLTARASKESRALSGITFAQVEAVIKAWTKEHIGEELPVCTEKGAGMLFLLDDSVVQVEHNTGRPIGGDAAFKVFEERIKDAAVNDPDEK